MNITDIKRYGASKKLLDIFSSFGLKELYPTQTMALKAGLLKTRESFVISAPTASGKTLIAEMAMLQAIEEGGKVIYLVPLRALASEKYDDFSKKYKDFGLKVMQSTGDFDSADPWLYKADIIISTNEKIDSLIRHRVSWLKYVNLIIADEVHLIGDPYRGPTLEMVLTRFRWLNPGLRIISLSATIPNALEISRWLNANLIESTWRPVPLKEGVYFNDAVTFNDGTVKWVENYCPIDVINLAIDTIKEGGQVLVFVNTRRATESLTQKAMVHIEKLIPKEDIKDLYRLSEDIIKTTPEPTKTCKKLSEHVLTGVAFHHAGINPLQRRIIESAFRMNKIKLIASTTTLAMGLNLPSRMVIIKDWWRYQPGMGMQPISVIEVKQMSGRAGRPNYDEYGESVLIAKNRKDEVFLFEKYIKGEIERIESKIGSEGALRTHILASIAGLFVRDRRELFDFIGKTFFAFQKDVFHLSSFIDNIINFLVNEGMVIYEKNYLKATKFGHRVSELYIDPLTGVIIRDALFQPKEKGVFPLLHMISSTPDMVSLSLRKKDYYELLDIFYVHSDDLLISEEEKVPTDSMISQLKVASVLMQWILESPEDKIVRHFGIGPGDLRTLIDLSDWLLYSASEIGKVFGLKEIEKTISALRTRVIYGVKEELLPLVMLKGIGRIRARNLYNSGYKTLDDIKEADIEELEKVPSIGKGIALDIKRQVSLLNANNFR
jgi:helicase